MLITADMTEVIWSVFLRLLFDLIIGKHLTFLNRSIEELQLARFASVHITYLNVSYIVLFCRYNNSLISTQLVKYINILRSSYISNFYAIF
jgi:hypothetical protein